MNRIHPRTIHPSPTARTLWALAVPALALALMLPVVSVQAASSSWSTPTSYPSDNTPPWPDWNDSSHWVGGVIPNGVGDVATFDTLTDRLNFRITDFSLGAELPGEATTITLGGLVHSGAGRIDTRPYGPVSTIIWDNDGSNASVSDTFSGELLLAHNHTLTSTIEVTKGGGQTRFSRLVSGPGGFILSGNQEFVLGETATANTFEGGVIFLDTSRVDVRQGQSTGSGPFTFTATSTVNSRITPRNNWTQAMPNTIVIEIGGNGWIRHEGGGAKTFSGDISGGGAFKLDPRDCLFSFTGDNSSFTGPLALVGDASADLTFGVEGGFNAAASVDLSNAVVFHITSADAIGDEVPVTMDIASRLNVSTGLDEVIGSLMVGGVPIADGTYTSSESWIEGDGKVSVGLAVPLIITEITPSGSDLVLTWDSKAGKVYNILGTTDLAADPSTWTLVMSNIPTTPPENTETIAKPADPSTQFMVEELPIPPLFSDDFETDMGWNAGVTSGTGTDWERGTPTEILGGPTAANTPVTCYATNIDSEYEINADVYLRSPEIDLTGATSGSLSFWQFYEIESPFDVGSVRVLKAGDLTPLGADIVNPVNGAIAEWTEFTAALPNEAMGENIVLEFQFQSDGVVTKAGWYIDDVSVTVE